MLIHWWKFHVSMAGGAILSGLTTVFVIIQDNQPRAHPQGEIYVAKQYG